MEEGFGTHREYLKFINHMDVSKVLSFAACKTASFMTMVNQHQHEVSMVPDSPNAKGMIHFYQETAFPRINV